MSNLAIHEPSSATIPVPPVHEAPGASPQPAPRATANAVWVTTVAAVSVVAAVAAAVSFMHMHELAARAGEGWRSWLIPLAIDGLVVAASMTMVVRRRAGRRAGLLAWISVTLGIAASLAANVAAAEPTLMGRAVAAWPPVALLLAYELLMGQIQAAGNRVASTQDTTQPKPQPDTTPTVTASAQSSTTDIQPAGQATPTQPNQVSAPAAADGSASTARPAFAPVLMAVPDVDENTDENVRQAARKYYLKTLADRLPCTGRELGDMYSRCERWGRYQIRAARRTLATARAAQDTAADAPPPAAELDQSSAQTTTS